MFYRFARAILCLVFYPLYRVKITGLENLPKDGSGYIVACNHRSNLDPIFLGITLRQTLTFMAKIELFQMPVIGRLFHWVGAFPVERGKGDTSAVDFAVKTVEEGKVLAMFPEGRRSPDGTLQRAKSGCAVIAAAAEARVVPVAICFTEKLHFRNTIIVNYGAPITPQELGVHPDTPSTIKAGSRLIMSRISVLLTQAQEMLA